MRFRGKHLRLTTAPSPMPVSGNRLVAKDRTRPRRRKSIALNAWIGCSPIRALRVSKMCAGFITRLVSEEVTSVILLDWLDLDRAKPPLHTAGRRRR